MALLVGLPDGVPRLTSPITETDPKQISQGAIILPFPNLIPSDTLELAKVSGEALPYDGDLSTQLLLDGITPGSPLHRGLTINRTLALESSVDNFGARFLALVDEAGQLDDSVTKKDPTNSAMLSRIYDFLGTDQTASHVRTFTSEFDTKQYRRHISPYGIELVEVHTNSRIGNYRNPGPWQNFKVMVGSHAVMSEMRGVDGKSMW